MDKQKIEEMVASKDRVIGEVYYRCRGLEERCQQLIAERDALAKELENFKIGKVK
jgi:regulator of replication initiation timing